MEDYNKYRKLIHKMTRRAHNKLKNLGANEEYDEILSEFVIAFCECQRSFDETRAVKFITYLYGSLNFKVINIVNKYIKQKNNFSNSTGEFLETLTDVDDSSLHAFDVSNLAVESGPDAQETLETKQLYANYMRNLSSEASLVLSNILYPTDDLLKEMSKLGHRQTYAIHRGIKPTCSRTGETAILAKAIFKKRSIVKRIVYEIKQLSALESAV